MISDKKLMFSIKDDAIYLHIGDSAIIPFEDLDQWTKFVNDMLYMIEEIKMNISEL